MRIINFNNKENQDHILIAGHVKVDLENAFRDYVSHFALH